MLDKEFLERKYFTWDLPIPFKGLNINPIKIEDYYEFMYSFETLIIEKNEIPNARIISMTYLDFIGYKLDEERDYQTIRRLVRVLELAFEASFDMNEINIEKEEEHYILIIKGTVIDFREFDDIRKIIMFQNFPDYEDKYIDPELRRDLEEYDRLKNKGIEYPSLEKQLLCLMASGFEKDYLQKLTMRKFKLLLTMVDSKLQYQILKTAEMSGMVKFKNDVDHWIYSTKKDKMAGKLVDLEGFKQKISSVGAIEG